MTLPEWEPHGSGWPGLGTVEEQRHPREPPASWSLREVPRAARYWGSEIPNSDVSGFLVFCFVLFFKLANPEFIHIKALTGPIWFQGEGDLEGWFP